MLRKVFSSYGTIVPEGFYLPTQGEGAAAMTCGYAFIEYSSADEAQRAVQEGNNKRLDAAHTLSVNLYDDVTRFEQADEEYTPPTADDFHKQVKVNAWLLDPLGRDQFVVRHSTQTEIFWNDPYRCSSDFGRQFCYSGSPELANSDKHWTDLYVAWSTQGSYLSTFHAQGIVIWAGDSFERVQRFAHQSVAVLDWSPLEKYLCTSNGMDAVAKSDPECFCIWSVKAATKLSPAETALWQRLSKS